MPNKQGSQKMKNAVVMKTVHPSMVIVLSADTSYSEQIITLIKSISYHHQNVKFYLLNKTFSDKWFEVLNQNLAPLNNSIVNMQITGDYSQFKTASHITETTYYRFLIQDLPEDKILYLDSDIIVDQPLDKLYSTRLGDKLVGAVLDMFLNHEAIEHHYLEYPDMKPYFNAGVLLINNKLWRKENMKEVLFKHLLELSGVYYADQDILNIVMKGKWKELPKVYNVQVGARLGFNERGLGHLIEEMENLGKKQPAIIHYTSKVKPWNREADRLGVKYSDRYWFYYTLSWNEIYTRHNL